MLISLCIFITPRVIDIVRRCIFAGSFQGFIEGTTYWDRGGGLRAHGNVSNAGSVPSWEISISFEGNLCLLDIIFRGIR